MTNISCAIIGLGNIGFEHNRNSFNLIQNHAKAFHSINKIKLICGIDKSYKKRKLFKKIYRVDTFKNLDEAKKLHNPELFVVSVNSVNLFNIVKKIALNFKPKVIVCEKPIAYQYNKILKLVSLLKKKRIKLFINFQRRSDPSYISLKKSINKNGVRMIGKVFYEKGFIYNCCHYINLMMFMFGRYKSHEVFMKKRLNNLDYKINTLVQFEKASVNFFYKKKCLKEFEFKNNKNYLVKFKNKALNYNSKKYENTLKYSQKNFYIELLKSIFKKKANICSADEAIETFRLIFLMIKKKQHNEK